MDQQGDPFAEFIDAFRGIFDTTINFSEGLLTPGWRQNQILILVVLVALAWLMHRVLGNVLRRYVQSREGWERWKLRVIVQIKRRLGLICFALMAWAVYVVMQNVTWPSRSYLVGIAATLATVYVSIAFAARLVRNPPLRRVVTWSLWIYATLYMLNVADDVAVPLLEHNACAAVTSLFP